MVLQLAQLLCAAAHLAGNLVPWRRHVGRFRPCRETFSTKPRGEALLLT